MAQPSLTRGENFGGPVYTIEVGGISEELLQRLDRVVRARGSDRSHVIRDIISRELGDGDAATAIESFEAALAPLRAGFAESGLTEQEVEVLLDDELRALRAERRRNSRVEPDATKG